jgi:hypothetical protein
MVLTRSAVRCGFDLYGVSYCVIGRRCKAGLSAGLCWPIGAFGAFETIARTTAASTAASAATPPAAATLALGSFVCVGRGWLARCGLIDLNRLVVTWRDRVILSAGVGGRRCFVASAIAASSSAITTAALLSSALRAVGFAAFELCGVSRFFHEISDIEEGVAFQANIHKAGLHARENACDATVVDRAGECVLVLALIVDFGEFVFFDDGEPRLMRRAGDVNFLRHCPAFCGVCWDAAGRTGEVRATGSWRSISARCSRHPRRGRAMRCGDWG